MTEKSTQDNSRPTSNGRRTLLDFGPLFVFWSKLHKSGLDVSVKILVVATVISLGLSWSYERRIPMMAAFGCGALVFFAGLTLYFDNELFIKVKPTVLTLMFATAIAGGRFIGRNPLAALMGSQLRLDYEGWRKLSWLVAMFVCSAIANEIAWRNLRLTHG